MEDGTETLHAHLAKTIVSQPLCLPLSRTGFHECDRGQVVLDFVNSLYILHSGNIIHCDIRPSNLMITSGGRGIIIDYGLAIATEEQGLRGSDLVHLVLILMYWCTKNQLFVAVRDPIEFKDIKGHMGTDWGRAAELALSCNYQGLVEALMALVKKIALAYVHKQ
jgi:serine/threonine protein kinase